MIFRNLGNDFQKSKQFSNEDVETPEDRKERKRSKRVIYMISFFGAISKRILFYYNNFC